VTEEAAEEAVTEDTAAEEAVTEAEETSAAEAGSAAVYVPGTYSAVAKGMESYVLVETTVDETSITGVTIDVSGETQGIGAAIGDQMAEAILEAQSADVDAVAGATVSSGAVIEALSHTLSEAAVKGEDQAEEAQEAVTENEAAGGMYMAGTYSATAAGISSDVKVEAEFDASSITNVTVDVSGETQGIGAAIGDQMAEAILEAQSADVETVSGATITSEAVKKAMEDVIAQAGGK
jgi:fumarate reductase flavoprotein subunit